LWCPGQPLKLAVRKTEGQIIDQAVRFYGSVKEAARRLGVDESTLTRKRSRLNSFAE
jgi:DNA-binding NtrC family response regulator